MPITRKKKAPVVEEQNIFGEPMAQEFEDIDGEDTNAIDPRDQRMEEMQKQIEAMRTLVEERNSELEYLRAPTFQSQVTQSEPSYDDPKKINLPDPALDPDGYSNAVERRTAITLENQRRRDDWQRRRDDDLNARVQSLWSAFSDAYPEIAVNNERVEYLAQKLAEEAKASGKDVEKYMFVTRKTFMKDLATRYEKVFGPVEEDIDPELDEEIDDPAPRRRTRNNSRSRNRDDEDTGRSAGILSGHPAGSSGVTRVKEDDGGLIADIQEAQRKSGFF